MPGILPMKVIKVGSSAQARIAQACDRCRSKKIRCDGFRPCCTQCAQVGFECQTSDKLSRRAFPRGYTESLEERVRALEGEVRELKDLLDAKDEKIDILSKVQSHSSYTSASSPQTSSFSSSPSSRYPRDPSQGPISDTFRSTLSTSMECRDGRDPCYIGSSSTRALADDFNRKLRSCGKPEMDVNISRLYSTKPPVADESELEHVEATAAPPRMFSDQMTNIYFQEWAPLIPVIHRPAFLRLYEQFIANPEMIKEKPSVAQLNLVFCIAASSVGVESPETQACEKGWRSALSSVLLGDNISSLQVLTLAQLRCIQKGDETLLQQYKAIASGTLQRLGLHQSQEALSLDTLSCETRKRVFWTLYTIDAFSAAFMGLPKLIRDEDVACEYPADVDDEYISKVGFEPSVPGEFTRISSALALFKGARILSKCLRQLYLPVVNAVSIQIPIKLEEELNLWYNELPQHLKMTFVKDKPSTNALTYHYIRTIIQRPAACVETGQKSSPPLVALASSGKNIIQIVQLLEERKMSFSFCVNKNDILIMSGLALLHQISDLDKESKLLKDSEKMVSLATDMLDLRSVPDTAELRRICHSVISTQLKSGHRDAKPHQRSVSSSTNASSRQWSPHKELQHIALRYSQAPRSFLLAEPKNAKDPRRATLASVSVPHVPNDETTRPFRPIAPSTNDQRAPSTSSFESLPPDVLTLPRPAVPSRIKDNHHAPSRSLNLDYFSFSGYSTPSATDGSQVLQQRSSVPTLCDDGGDLDAKGNVDLNVNTDLESLLSCMNTDASWPPFDDIMGTLPDDNGGNGGSGDAPNTDDVKPCFPDAGAAAAAAAAEEELYGLKDTDLFCDAESRHSKARSWGSYSEESLTSGGDECPSLDPASAAGAGVLGGMMIPGLGLDGLVQEDEG